MYTIYILYENYRLQNLQLESCNKIQFRSFDLNTLKFLKQSIRVSDRLIFIISLKSTKQALVV